MIPKGRAAVNRIKRIHKSAALSRRLNENAPGIPVGAFTFQMECFMPDNQHDRLMSICEVASRLQCHPTSVKRILANSEGPTPVRIGGRDRFYESRFNEWLESRSV